MTKKFKVFLFWNYFQNKQKNRKPNSLRLKQFEQYFRNFPFYFKNII
nr:MAG TPA: hypothetical protein [Caudoviricetes sp.]DAX45135.1 MAG TPA: hypothetical protein [Caudoviricetes sp.]